VNKALIIMLFLLFPVVASSQTTTEVKYHHGEGQYDLLTVNIDAKNKKGKMIFLNSEFSNIPDSVVAAASDLKSNKHGIDLKKYQHIEFEFPIYSNSKTFSFISPSLSLQSMQYNFVFIGTIKRSSIAGTIYEYRVDSTGQRFLSEIPVK
jgi:hypothetical protein